MAYALYDAMLVTEPLKMFNKYSVAPPSGLHKLVKDPNQLCIEGQVIKELPQKMTASNMGATTTYGDDAGGFSTFGSAVVEDQKRVCYGHLVNGEAQYRGGLALSVALNEQPNWVPIYFLPWDSKKIYSMVIPDKAADAADHPNIFFTAAINGCSVFVRGTQENPTIYHAGINTDMHGNLPYKAPDFWRDFLKYVALKEGRVLTPADYGEVNTTDYMNQFLSEKTADKTTLRVELYKDWLKDEYRKQLRIESVSPWGCVFGIRTGKKWRFYLQENAAIQYAELRKVKKTVVVGKKYLGLKKITKDVEEVVEMQMTTRSRPLVIREFFPRGSGVATPQSTQRIM
jgi:hypothetical protein